MQSLSSLALQRRNPKLQLNIFLFQKGTSNCNLIFLRSARISGSFCSLIVLTPLLPVRWITVACILWRLRNPSHILVRCIIVIWHFRQHSIAEFVISLWGVLIQKGFRVVDSERQRQRHLWIRFERSGGLRPWCQRKTVHFHDRLRMQRVIWTLGAVHWNRTCRANRRRWRFDAGRKKLHGLERVCVWGCWTFSW